MVHTAHGGDICGSGPFSLQCLLDDTAADCQILGGLFQGSRMYAQQSILYLAESGYNCCSAREGVVT